MYNTNLSHLVSDLVFEFVAHVVFMEHMTSDIALLCDLPFRTSFLSEPHLLEVTMPRLWSFYGTYDLGHRFALRSSIPNFLPLRTPAPRSALSQRIFKTSVSTNQIYKSKATMTNKSLIKKRNALIRRRGFFTSRAGFSFHCGRCIGIHRRDEKTSPLILW